MTSEDADHTLELRRRAVEKLHGKAPVLSEGHSAHDVPRLLQELQVHQIELEIQNEELREANLRKEALLARFEDLYDFAPVGYLTVSADALFLEVNHTAADLLGAAPGTLVGQSLFRFILPEYKEVFSHHLARLFASGAGQVFDLQLMPLDRPPFWAKLDISAARDDRQAQLVCRVAVSDIDQRKRSEEALLASEMIYLSLFENMLSGFARCRMIFDGEMPVDFLYLNVNRAFEKQTGFQGVIGKKMSEVMPGFCEKNPGLLELYGKVASTGVPEQREMYIEELKQWRSISSYSPAKGFFVAVFDVITERKRAEAAREATLELLQLCSRGGNLSELTGSLLEFFQKVTGCEAVGIRLGDGGAFPYYATCGFPEAFLQAEKCLCVFDRQGGVLRDHLGLPAVDCMCGTVLGRRFDPSAPFFTSHGSFWTNSISELIPTAAVAENRAKASNLCRDEGYESVALIPLQYKGEIHGLFQCNDRKKGRFTPESIALLEELVAHVAIALLKLQSDEALRTETARVKTILDNAADAVFVASREGRFSYVNSQAASMLDCDRESLLPKGLADIVPPEEAAQVLDRLNKLKQSEKVLIETSLLREGFGAVPVEINVVRLPNEDLFASCRDVTQRKLSDERLRKLYMAVDQSPAMVMITDREGNVEFVNPCFSKVTGYSSADVLGQNVSAIYGNTCDERTLDMWATISGGDSWEGDFQNKKKDGTLYWEHDTISPIRNEVGAITHYLAIKEDTTARRSLEDQLRQSQKMEAVGQLAGGIAHDYNNILQVISGNTQLQLMAVRKQGVDAHYLDEILRAVERGASLTRSLLVFCRKQPLDLSVFDLNTLVRESQKLATRLVTGEISITLELAADELKVKGDFSLLQNVIFNLVTNARDAIAGRGKIGIGTALVELTREFIAKHRSDAPAGCYAALTVTDSGCGIGAEIMDKIFEPFFTTKEIGKGTGLGLAMIYGTIQQMDGFIAVDSPPGGGTTFGVYIPLTKEHEQLHPAEEEAESVLGKGELILVVEDEEAVRNSLAQFLTLADYRVLCAANGEDAVTLARENAAELQLIVMDIVLPDINGVEVAREIYKTLPGVPVIFVSGYNNQQFDTDGIVGCCLHKPVHPMNQLKHIHRLLKEPGAGKKES